MLGQPFWTIVWFLQRADVELWSRRGTSWLALHTCTEGVRAHTCTHPRTHTHSLTLSNCLLPIRYLNKSSQTENDLMLLSFSRDPTYPWNPKEQRGWSIEKNRVQKQSYLSFFTGNICLVQEIANKCWKHKESLTLHFSDRYVPTAVEVHLTLRCEHLST